MTLAHVHLAACHFPIIGTLLAIPLVLLVWRRLDLSTLWAAAIVLAISGVGAAVTVATGESAEELVEHVPSVNVDAIESHEESAELAAGLTIATGIAAIVLLAVAARRGAVPKLGVAALLGATTAAAGVAAWAGWLGGSIRHTELATSVEVVSADASD
jgi:hypothetical protein